MADPRREHFESGASEHHNAPFTDRYGHPAWQDPDKPVTYDEHIPKPTRPGMVEFGGAILPANTFYKSDDSIGFTTPMENGAVGAVQYFPRQQKATAVMYDMHTPEFGGVTGGVLGARDKHGVLVSDRGQDVSKAIREAHGGEDPHRALAPHEAVESLRRWSQLSVPEHVRKANQKAVPLMSQQWGWKP